MIRTKTVDLILSLTDRVLRKRVLFKESYFRSQKFWSLVALSVTLQLFIIFFNTLSSVRFCDYGKLRWDLDATSNLEVIKSNGRYIRDSYKIAVCNYS